MLSRKWLLFPIFVLFLAFGCSYTMSNTPSQPGAEKQYKSFVTDDPFERRRSDYGR